MEGKQHLIIAAADYLRRCVGVIQLLRTQAWAMRDDLMLNDQLTDIENILSCHPYSEKSLSYQSGMLLFTDNRQGLSVVICATKGCKRDPSRGNLWCKECAMQRKRLSSVSSARTSVASTGSPQLGLGLLESPDSNTRKRPEQHSRIFAELVAKLPPYDFQIHKRCKLGNI